mmetsp:Transcript_40113/g.80947  ORF Transcript_40113/g.80947 Transcript_40113/m.80947 type:complete len:209 (-) Transcript_40113:217-843(-)
MVGYKSARSWEEEEVEEERRQLSSSSSPSSSSAGGVGVVLVVTFAVRASLAESGFASAAGVASNLASAFALSVIDGSLTVALTTEAAAAAVEPSGGVWADESSAVLARAGWPSLGPTESPTAQPSPPPTFEPTTTPTSAPTSAPTAVLRGFRDCVCFSAITVRKLKVHCPEVAEYFSEDSCMHNMTKADLAVVARGCAALQKDFLRSG